jgi:long-chain acyl-CoA synthetase
MKPALIHGDRVVTSAELDAASDRLAGALGRRGIGRGDRVTLFMPNSIEFVIAFYATLRAGGVVNPINAQSKEREVRFQVEDSGAKAVFVHEALWPVVEPIRVELGEQRLLARTGNAPGVDITRFDDLVAETGTAPTLRADLDELAALRYTSGTTGFPKA